MSALQMRNIGKQIDITMKDGWYVISVGNEMIARVPSEGAIEKAIAYIFQT